MYIFTHTSAYVHKYVHMLFVVEFSCYYFALSVFDEKTSPLM